MLDQESRSVDFVMNRIIMHQEKPVDAPMTVAELSQYLKLDRMTIYKMLKEGTVPASRIGHQWRFFREDVDNWLRSHSTRQQRTALIVNSDATTRDLIEVEFSDHHFDVVTASTADEAIEVASERQFNVVFLELNRPAIRVFGQLRESDPTVPVVLTAESVSGRLIQRAMEIGRFAMMRKPSTREDIARTLSAFPSW